MASAPPPVLYSRGFYFSQKPPVFLNELPHYREYKAGRFKLFADELLEVDLAEKKSVWVVVLGKALPLSTGIVDPSAHSVAAQILEYVCSDGGGLGRVEEALYDLGGRYAIGVGTPDEVYFYNDAAGTRSVFYDALNCCVSSHYDMLAGVGSREEGGMEGIFSEGTKDELQWHLTPNPRVKALTANMRLALRAGELERYHLMSPNRARELTHEQRLDRIQSLWNEQVQQILALELPMAISLSGGIDSRLMLATIRGHEERFHSMTYTTSKAIEGIAAETKWERVMNGDYQLVQELRELRPSRHTFIPRTPQRWVSDNSSTLKRNATNNHGQWILPGYLSLFPDRRTVHYRGNLLEIGRLHFGLKSGVRGRARVMSIVRFASSRYEAAEKELLERTAAEAMDYLRYDDISADYNLSDVYYWEMRHSRWYAQLLNETDVAFDSLTPFNVRRIIDLFLAYDDPDRASALVQSELIYRYHPLLTFFGMNEPTDLYRRFVSSGRRLNRSE